MARIRQIKPDFFLDADLTELSPLHRLLFAGLWCQADRAGRLEDKPREIKVRVLPYDDCDTDVMLADLDRAGFILRYQIQGRRLLAIRNFERHQHFHRQEKESDLPPPPVAGAVSTDAAAAIIHAATAQAPVEHGASIGQAPVQSAGDRVSGIGDRVSGIGGGGSAAPPLAPLNSVTASLSDRMQAAFSKAKGAAYAWTRRDDDALRQLSRLSSGDDDEVMRRWEIALAWAGFPACTCVRDLSEKWNAYAQAQQARAGPARDVKKGRVGAEEIDKAAFAKTGAVNDF